MPKLSIVIPVFNEEELIEKTLKELDASLKKLKLSYEIVIADDGSSDSTVKIIGGLNNSKIKIYSLKINKGKGAALKLGISKTTGEKIIFMDADLSVPLKYLKPLITALDETDVAIGTRRTKNSKIVVRQPIIRETMGRVFTKLTQIFTNTNLTDYTCGFKGFKKKAAKKVFKKSLVDRWAYDAEILFLANKYNFSISEVPVEWYNRADTKVQIGSAAVTALIDLVKLRLRDLQGLYEK